MFDTLQITSDNIIISWILFDKKWKDFHTGKLQYIHISSFQIYEYLTYWQTIWIK